MLEWELEGKRPLRSNKKWFDQSKKDFRLLGVDDSRQLARNREE